MKKRFEIELRQRVESTVRDEALREPVEWGSREGAEDNRRREISEQSGCVLQDVHVRLAADA